MGYMVSVFHYFGSYLSCLFLFCNCKGIPLLVSSLKRNETFLWKVINIYLSI